MVDFNAVCIKCGNIQNPGPVYTCKQCDSGLEIQFNYDQIFRKISFSQMQARKIRGIWKYRELLPVLSDVEPVTLGEGDTPLLKIGNIPEISGRANVLLKKESVNPTLAFKDRPMSVALTAARQFGMSEVVCASTGNTGVAASAYAARAGIPCSVYVPFTTPEEKLLAMRQYGAQLKLIEGTYSDAYDIAKKHSLERQAFNLTSTYLNPFAVEGDKTVAYEIVEQLGNVPDWVVVPIGAGPLLAGCYKGFKEMKAIDFIDKLPRMAGVQAAGCAPIAAAYAEGKREVEPWKSPQQTKASGIADPLASYSGDGTRTLSVIYESGGVSLAVPEEKLFHYRKRLAELEGVLAELSSVTALAAVEQMLEKNVAQPGDTIVAVVTGHGFKDMTVTI